MMKFALVPVLSVLFLAPLAANADDLSRHPQQVARNTDDKNGKQGGGDATSGKDHGDKSGSDHAGARGGGHSGGPNAGGAAAASGALNAGSGRGHGDKNMGGSNTVGATTHGAASTAGSGRGRNHGNNQMGGANTAGASTPGTASTAGSGRSRNHANDQMGGSTAVGSAPARGLSVGGTRAGGQASVTGFGARPSNWNNYPRRFDSNVYQRNITAPRRYHWQSYNRPSGWYYQRWVFGHTFPRIFWARDYWMFDLPIPPYGYEWVRYGDDAVLINVRTGRVLQVVYGLFD